MTRADLHEALAYARAWRLWGWGIRSSFFQNPMGDRSYAWGHRRYWLRKALRIRRALRGAR